MMSRNCAFVLAMGLACMACLGRSHQLLAAEKPNVLFIAVDDLNHWVGYFGRNPQSKTPNLDRLAARGLAFTQAHCAVPACNPSRAALMSGLRPWSTGCYTNSDPWKQHIKEGLGLSKQFLDAGYHVAGAGKIYHSDTYYESEWSEYMDKQGLSATGKGVGKNEGFLEPLKHDLADQDLSDWQIVDWCIERLQQQRDEPLFLACGLHKPHLPFAVPRKYYDMFPLDQIQLPPYRGDDLDDIPPAGVKMAKPDGDHAKFLESGRWKAAIQSYLATVAYTDMNIGRLLDALDRSSYRDNTIIVLWGDHGWHFGEKHHWRKFALWEEATRAPLIWVAPGVTRPGTQCDRTVDFMSIYPTLCDLANMPVPQHVQGRSIRALLQDPAADWDEPAITTHGYQNHAVRSQRWRFIQYADGSQELYDHSEDPYEWNNLAADPQQKQVLRHHAGHLPQSNVKPAERGGKRAAVSNRQVKRARE